MNTAGEVRPASCILCATPRSGSTLLCDLLSDTGVAGHPHSYFRREDFAEWAEYFGVSTTDWPSAQAFDRAYLDAVLKYGSAKTGVFGLRLMWESLDDLSSRLDEFFPGLPSDDARFAAAFGRPVYVYLSREDKVSQAISRRKAEQTGLWHVEADGTERERVKAGETPTYDPRELAELVSKLQEHDAAWQSWFAEQGIAPVRVTYERLSSEPRTVLAPILAALGQDESIAGTVKPRTAKLADTESREWAERFRTERGGSST